MDLPWCSENVTNPPPPHPQCGTEVVIVTMGRCPTAVAEEGRLAPCNLASNANGKTSWSAGEGSGCL